MIRSFIALTALPLAACAVNESNGPISPYEVQQQLRVESAVVPVPSAHGTIVSDQAALDRLRGNSGITLQWIGWDDRGQLEVTQPAATIYLRGSQTAGDGTGKLSLDGTVTDISSDRFSFDGTITIIDTPDAGRDCVRSGPMLFQVTQNRKYWRLQNMEACGDGLTDYVDIYF